MSETSSTVISFNVNAALDIHEHEVEDGNDDGSCAVDDEDMVGT